MTKSEFKQTTTEVSPQPPAELRVLHIEDNPSDARLMQEHLRGIRPSVSFDDAERLADLTASRAESADCALLDLSLPDASGLDALLAVRQMSDRLPIIVLTGFDDMELGMAAVRDGADDYLVKNHVDGYTLERAIQYAIERRRLLLQLDSSIAETIVAQASSVSVGAAMTAALQLLQQTLANGEPSSSHHAFSGTHEASVRLDRQSRELELELEDESGDWVDNAQHRAALEGETTQTSAALAELRLIVLDDQRRNATLLRIIQLAKRAIPHLVDASITVLDGHRARTVVFTGPLAVDLDDGQFEVGIGPCLDAALTVDAVVVTTGEENPYPHFSLAARRAGITHSISVALPVAERIVGALNLYVASPRPVDPDTIVMGQAFASCAGVVVADAGSHFDAPERAMQMQKALETRSTVEQAKGILMAQNHYTSMEAFETLTFVSQNENREIGEVAAALVAMVQQRKA